MGLLLKNDTGWSPKQAISSAFFEDALAIIDQKEEYQLIEKDIKDAIFFYTYTLDYRDKPMNSVILLVEVVIILLYRFNEIYSGRGDEEAIKIYKTSLQELKSILFKNIISN